MDKQNTMLIKNTDNLKAELELLRMSYCINVIGFGDCNEKQKWSI